MSDEEIKNEFINCIEGTHTLNLAISILEDRERLKAESTEWESRYYDMQDNFHNANEEIEELQNIIKEVENINEKMSLALGSAESKLQQKENIIKEAREYIEDKVCCYAFNNKELKHWEFNDNDMNGLLDILDKENGDGNNKEKPNSESKN